MDPVEAEHGNADVGFGTKLLLGSISGTVGSVVGNPGEIAIVRMCNDSKSVSYTHLTLPTIYSV